MSKTQIIIKALSYLIFLVSEIGFGYLIRNKTTKVWENYVKEVRNKYQKDQTEQSERYKTLNKKFKEYKKAAEEAQIRANAAIANKCSA